MDNHISAVAEAFSYKALEYDQFGEGHENLAAMRRKVRQHALKYLRTGDHILELNAGTGSDAVFFGERGFDVLATDISPGMIAQIEEKIIRFGLRKSLKAELCSFTALNRIDAGPFDFVFSNMGGVNCYSNLTEIVANIRQLIRAGSIITWVVMPPVCLWELAQIFRGEFKTAFRRLSPRGTLANVNGVHFMTYYYTPREVIQAFGEDFSVLEIQGLSVFTPPADRKEFAIRHNRLYRIFQTIDKALADMPPLNQTGDFFIITLQYLPG